MKRNTLFAGLLGFAVFFASAAFASDVVGYWASTGFDKGNGEVIGTVYDIPVSIAFHLQLHEDGTLVALMFGDKMEGTWTFENDVVALLNPEGEKMELPMKDGKLHFGMDEDVSVILEKQSVALDVEGQIAKAAEAMGE